MCDAVTLMQPLWILKLLVCLKITQLWHGNKLIGQIIFIGIEPYQQITHALSFISCKLTDSKSLKLHVPSLHLSSLHHLSLHFSLLYLSPLNLLLYIVFRYILFCCILFCCIFLCCIFLRCILF